MDPATILCIDDEPDLLDTLRRVLGRAGHRVVLATSGEEGLVALDQERPDIVVTDLMMPGVGGLQVLDRSRKRHPDVPVVLVTAYATVENAVEAIRRGAYDYLAKPFTHQQLLVTLDRALKHRRLQAENQRLKAQIASDDDTAGIIAASGAMQRVLDMVRRVAPTDLGVLITGESGTGKEVVARAIHRLSRRRDGPFVPVDCGAIPNNLMESELFGHEKGAFTGASGSRAGLVEAADGGTFFLDEIGELDMAVQVKLLRLLQEAEYRRVGGTRLLSADLRVVAATNRNLVKAVQEGAFREDLFHRLNVVQVDIPPLRERRDDVPVLLDHFLRRLCVQGGREELRLDPAVRQVLQTWTWPGNVRELLNVCRYLVGLAEGPVVGLADLPPALRRQLPQGAPSGGCTEPPAAPARGPEQGVRYDLPYKQAKRAWLEAFEEAYITRLLEAHGGNISQAAREAGIDRKSIQRLMKRNDITVDGLEGLDDEE